MHSIFVPTFSSLLSFGWWVVEMVSWEESSFNSFFQASVGKQGLPIDTYTPPLNLPALLVLGFLLHIFYFWRGRS